MNKLVSGLLLSISVVITSPLMAKGKPFEDKFRQLDELLPTPNTYRTASGAPGHEYWQQEADYKIRVKLDDEKQTLTASETITYKNNSPDTLTYLWLQLDQNRFKRDSLDKTTRTTRLKQSNPKTSFKSMRGLVKSQQHDGGYDITKVTDKNGRDLPYIINDTMMRIDLPTGLKPHGQFVFNIDWNYHIREQKVLGGRSGYEYFKEDENYLYEIAQWFPRMAAYYDVYGWQNKQFLGNGEFALEFGDYDVEITVPSDHIVASTGELQNPRSVLTSAQRKRLEKAKYADKPVIIVSEEEATEKEKTKSSKMKTWRFKAENVRDFAWASSRKFIWDAQGYTEGGIDTMAMSYYPKEGNPLWERYSTEAIIHTIEHYNKYSLQYPYPVSISVNGPVGGMEYPMITFNGPRPKVDKKTGEKTYSKRTKYGLIGVIIHEVGHNYYPMIVNSDERQWTWMDEGLNTFVQFLAEQAWEEKYPSRRGPARKIVNYMKSSHQVPIMTNSESILQFGNNAYGKPATALNILRETIMGRELFDFAFKEYAERWKFKRPTPADFFRTLEDASAVDLDWFIRGWFYTTDHVDISLDRVTKMHIGSQDPEVEKAWDREQFNKEPADISDLRNQGMPVRTDKKPELLDFYNEHDKFTVTNHDRNKYNSSQKKLEDWQLELLNNGSNIYTVDFSNKGGLVMPIILQVKYADGSDEVLRISAQIWRKNTVKVSKMLITDKAIKEIVLDPYWETADVDVNNNYWPTRVIESRLELYKRKKSKSLMEKYNEKLKTDDDADKETDAKNEDKEAA
ncbi:M1 family metallopeptidase [Psychrobium sp. 1_MG-2023]|uniref:M1 family metallopeptidase n=1 Tax=Psychrobium sp. 1_MG-2023 TaxID=3062624 RepID=UPI000C31EBB5|nr:M1 family metallopeptidase [Psychrobium sp. 1_MG-2023]MDP2562748.1 M1 family metallopeptidase [Psychrobium sp. 1_MG-2023]PKF54171.1 aminopeptidase [Alteromonadales bacterium alter-6D02]